MKLPFTVTLTFFLTIFLLYWKLTTTYDDKTELLIIRHSETLPDNHFKCENNITENGYFKAKLFAELLVSKGYTQIIVSPYIECQETARAMNEVLNLPVVIDQFIVDYIEENVSCDLKYKNLIYTRHASFDSFVKACKFNLDRIVSHHSKAIIITHGAVVECLDNLYHNHPIKIRHIFDYLDGFRISGGHYKSIWSPFEYHSDL